MQEIKVTTELSADDRKLFDAILHALEVIIGGPCEMATTPSKTLEVPRWEAPNAEEAPKAEETPEVRAEAPADPTVTHADIQHKVVELSAAGKKAAVRDIIKAYAVKVSAIPDDKLAEVWNKLTALEG